MTNKNLSAAAIKKLLKENQYITGTERTIKSLRLGKAKMVILTSNCPQKTGKDIEYYASLGKTEVVKLDIPNEELAIICKKPFAISVMCILKGANK